MYTHVCMYVSRCLEQFKQALSGVKILQKAMPYSGAGVKHIHVFHEQNSL